jgi:hypothetical protein
MGDDRLAVRPVDVDTPSTTRPTADDAARLGRDLADIAAATGLKLNTGRTPDDDGLVYCCVTLGRVTPAVAAGHVEDTYPYDPPGTPAADRW